MAMCRTCRNALTFLALAIIFIGVPASAANKKPPLHPINLNSATASELEQVPGIGPATAEKILKMRKSFGPFKSVDDLRAIKGIGPKRMEKMRKYLAVGKPAAPKKPANAASPPSPSNNSKSLPQGPPKTVNQNPPTPN